MDPTTLAAAEYWLSVLHRVDIFAGILVAVGVAYEWGAPLIARRYERIVEEANEKELARLNADVAEANLLLERERVERLKLEEKLAPRRLSVDQQDAIAARLRAFPGTRVGVILCGGLTWEPARLAQDIMAALAAAKWVVGPSGTRSTVGIVGIEIELEPDSSETVANAANALIAALQSEQLSVKSTVSPPIGIAPVGHADAGTAPVRINIGEKP